MKMKRCLTLCGKATYVKGKNGRPIVAARIGNVVGYLVLIRQHTLCLRLLSCEELADIPLRVALENITVNSNAFSAYCGMIEHICVRKNNTYCTYLIHRLVRVLSQSLEFDWCFFSSVCVHNGVEVF